LPFVTASLMRRAIASASAMPVSWVRIVTCCPVGFSVSRSLALRCLLWAISPAAAARIDLVLR